MWGLAADTLCLYSGRMPTGRQPARGRKQEMLIRKDEGLVSVVSSVHQDLLHKELG